MANTVRFGELMLSLMHERGVGFRALARKANCDHSYLSKLSRGIGRPSETLAKSLDNVLEANGRLLALVATASEIKPKKSDEQIVLEALLKAARKDDIAEAVTNLLRRTLLQGNSGAIGPDLEDSARTIKGSEVVAWVQSTNTNDGIIEYINSATQCAAEDHVYLPPVRVLARVRQLQIMVDSLLRGGRQRLRQTRDLMRLYADLSAHMCQLLGDVNQDREASAYGEAAMALAGEAESNPAAAFSALAQIARWRHRHADAADLAAKGLKHHPSQNLKILLAYQEANAAAAAGQQHRAREAMAFAEAIDGKQEPHSAWSCPPPRRALYRIGTALNLGDPREALRQADDARPLFQDGFPQVAYGTWAHYQICVTNAHLMLGSVDGAAKYITPVLDLPSEYRLSTLKSHVAGIDSLLEQRHFVDSPEVASIRTSISRFTQDTSLG